MKPQVTIELAPYLQDYLYHEFAKTEDGEGEYRLPVRTTWVSSSRPW